MDLVEEEDCPLARAGQAFPGPLDHGPYLSPARLDRALLFERGIRAGGQEASEGRLAAPRRSVQDHRVDVSLLDRPPQRGAGGQQLVLADELLQRAGAQAGGQGGVGGRSVGGRRLASVEQLLHTAQVWLARRGFSGPGFPEEVWLPRLGK